MTHLSQGQDRQKGPSPTLKKLETKVSMGVKDLKARKGVKRRMKQKANNAVVDRLSSELNDIKPANIDMNEMFKEFFITAKLEMSHKIVMREAKISREEDRIMMIDTSTMPHHQASYYEQRKVEIMQKRYGSSSSPQ